MVVRLRFSCCVAAVNKVPESAILHYDIYYIHFTFGFESTVTLYIIQKGTL